MPVVPLPHRLRPGGLAAATLDTADHLEDSMGAAPSEDSMVGEGGAIKT